MNAHLPFKAGVCSLGANLGSHEEESACQPPKAGARSLILQVQRYKLFLIIQKKQRNFQQKIQIAMWRLQFYAQKKSFEKTRHSSPVAL